MILVVIGHAKTRSLCHHLLDAIVATLEASGEEYRVHDLLGDGFDPVLRLEPEATHVSRNGERPRSLIQQYRDDVVEADAFIIVHPVWWFGPPAILKGWVDRVLVDGVALSHPAAGPPRGLLHHRRALVVQTLNTSPFVDRVVFGRLAYRFWRRGVFQPVGVRRVRRVAIYGAARITEQRLQAARERTRREVTRVAGAMGKSRIANSNRK